jgi:hypothetical protein
MDEHKLVSADSHVNEPGDLWVERIDKAFRDRAPRVVDNLPGRQPGSYLVLEDIPPIHLAGSRSRKEAGGLPNFFQQTTYKDARRGGWDPAERLKDMEMDGVEGRSSTLLWGFASSGSRTPPCSKPVSAPTTIG